MVNHPNRGRINCAPLSIHRDHHGLLMGLPRTVEPLAYTYGAYPLVPDGVLIRMKSTARLCKWIGGSIHNLDQGKASAALTKMQTRIEEGYDWKRRNDDAQSTTAGSARSPGSDEVA